MATRSDNQAGRRVAELAARCESVLTTAELRRCGLSPENIRTRMRHGTLHRIHEGVYAVGHANLSPLAKCVAAVKACGPDAVLGFASALASMGLLPWDQALPPEVLLHGCHLRVRPGIRVHRTKHLPPLDIRDLGCIRVTSPARTIADMAGRFSARETLELVREGQGNHLVNHRQLLSVHQRLGRRPGSGRLAKAIALGPAPTRSVLESVVLDLILSGGLARPDVNVPLWVEARRVVPDFRWPEQHLIVEADGAAWHSGIAAKRADVERQALLEAAGERVLRVSWHQAVAQQRATLKRLQRAGAPIASPLSTQGA